MGKTLVNKPKLPSKKLEYPKAKWEFGIGNLGGKLDHVNIRDFALSENDKME